MVLLLLLLYTCFAALYWHLSCLVIKCLDYWNIIVIVFNAPEKHFSYLCFRLHIDFLICSLTCKGLKSLHTSDSRMCTGSCSKGHVIYEIYYASKFQRIVFFIKPSVLQTVPLSWLQPHSPVTMFFLFFLLSFHCFAVSLAFLEGVIYCGRSPRGGHVCWWRFFTTLAATKEGGSGGFYIWWAVPEEAEDQQCLPGAAQGLRDLRITSAERQTWHELGLDRGILWCNNTMQIIGRHKNQSPSKMSPVYMPAVKL